jgi:hypothetical protein
VDPSGSTFATLRCSERERRITVLRQRLRDTLVPTQCSVWLFGSLARSDWDGFSDTDLLVVAASRENAERTAEWLGEAQVGDACRAGDRVRGLSGDGPLPFAPLVSDPRSGDPPPPGIMNQARPRAWGRQARNDLELAESRGWHKKRLDAGIGQFDVVPTR